MKSEEGSITYEDGAPLRYQQLLDGRLIDIPKDEWPPKPKYFQVQKEPVKADTILLIKD